MKYHRRTNIKTEAVVARAFVGSTKMMPVAMLQEKQIHGAFGWDELACGHWRANEDFSDFITARWCPVCDREHSRKAA
jgi:hypothetical protein